MEDSLRDVVDEIEAEKALGKVAGYEVFRSRINQPNLLAVRSTDAIQNNSGTGFSEMLFNIPRSILEVETIQLLTANIPQCVPSIPDTALVFWYYRLSEYSGNVPNPENLFFVRLLPSYYRQEFVDSPSSYGFNKTFNSYPQLATALALSCSTDLGYYNVGAYDPNLAGFDFRFLPNEISLPYNADINKFQMVGTNAQTQLAYKQYSGATTYGEDDVVYQGTNTFISLQSGNVGNATSSAVWWKQIYVDIVAPYSATTLYPIGRYVSYTNLLYKSIATNIGQDPTNATFWVQIIEDASTINYRYLIAGFDDPNVALLQGTAYRTWNEYALYEIGAIVLYKGLYYEALFQNQNVAPDSMILSWGVSGTPPLVVGLNACSAGCDMVEQRLGILRVPFPEGIPGQPFNPIPKRLLNSILGFSWNGIMTPSFLQTIVQGDYINFIPTTRSDLYNRVRPVPLYVTPVASGLGSSASASSSTQTYTADGYCNLVYSSIVSIYASVVYGSTTDSKRNTSLVAMGSMNCGNLGVSFFAGFVDNPLLIEGNDIYDLSISLQDEYGEPYVLTNNAVASFTFKLTYKTKG